MNLSEFLNKRSKSFFVVAGLLMVVLLGLSDYLAGPDFSFLLFYIAPIFFVAWYVGKRAAFVTSLLTAMIWFIAETVTPRPYVDPFIKYWNLSIIVAFFLIISHVLSSLKHVLDLEKGLARTDELTGIANRRSFFELAGREIDRARRYHHPFTIAYIDVDDFKAVNDRFGHKIGDMVLRIVAKTIQENTRTADVVARIGGDEFVIVLSETDSPHAEIAIQRIRQHLANALGGHKWSAPTISVGVATWALPPDTVDAVIKRVDELMYASKKEGKNQVKFEILDQTS